MSQRDSGYERKERDCYETPEWVTDALGQYLAGTRMKVWEPACASGKMVNALKKFGLDVVGTDIDQGHDFLQMDARSYDAIITNPPYALATEFIKHALDLTAPTGCVGMLLRTDFDHAASRHELFADHPAFKVKLVLTRRIRWFEESKGSPSFNHAWFFWDWNKPREEKPILLYGPEYRPIQKIIKLERRLPELHDWKPWY